MARFVQAFEVRDGAWRVALRWNREDPFELLEATVARERAEEAERNGDTKLAHELRVAADEADRQTEATTR